MSTGLDLRHDGQRIVIENDREQHREYVRRAIDICIRHGVNFNADVVRYGAALLAACEGKEFRPHSPNLLPAVIGGYVSAGRIQRVGEYHSTRKERRYGRNSVYRGVTA